MRHLLGGGFIPPELHTEGAKTQPALRWFRVHADPDPSVAGGALALCLLAPIVAMMSGIHVLVVVACIQSVFGAALAIGALGMASSREQWGRAGVDGILVEKRFVSWDAIRNGCVRHARGLKLASRIVVGASDAEWMRPHLAQRRRQGASPLDRAGRPIARWREDVRALARPAGYRAALLPARALDEALAASWLERRLGAAMAVADPADPGVTARLRALAGEHLEPNARAALLSIADGRLDERATIAALQVS